MLICFHFEQHMLMFLVYMLICFQHKTLQMGAHLRPCFHSCSLERHNMPPWGQGRSRHDRKDLVKGKLSLARGTAGVSLPARSVPNQERLDFMYPGFNSGMVPPLNSEDFSGTGAGAGCTSEDHAQHVAIGASTHIVLRPQSPDVSADPAFTEFLSGLTCSHLGAVHSSVRQHIEMHSSQPSAASHFSQPSPAQPDFDQTGQRVYSSFASGPLFESMYRSAPQGSIVVAPVLASDVSHPHESHGAPAVITCGSEVAPHRTPPITRCSKRAKILLQDVAHTQTAPSPAGLLSGSHILAGDPLRARISAEDASDFGTLLVRLGVRGSLQRNLCLPCPHGTARGQRLSP